MSLPGFDAVTCEDVGRDIAALCEGSAQMPGGGDARTVRLASPSGASDKPEAVIEVPVYAGDPLVRRGRALQATAQPDGDCVYLNQATVKQLGLKAGGQAVIKGDGAETVVSVVVDDSVGDGSYLLYAARPGATAFSGASQIQILKV